MFPDYTPVERRIDGAIHYLGIALAGAGVAELLWRSGATGDSRRIVAAAAYCIGLLATIGFSAGYHLIDRQDWKEIVRRCDRTAIYLMIAGTYTPFALVALGDGIGFVLLGAVWLIALCGIALVWWRPRRFERARIVIYLALGWIGLPVFGALPGTTLALLGAGGLLYSLGVCFHLWHRLPGQNAVWHGLVLVAAACHYVAVFRVLTG